MSWFQIYFAPLVLACPDCLDPTPTGGACAYCKPTNNSIHAMEQYEELPFEASNAHHRRMLGPDEHLTFQQAKALWAREV